MFKKLLFVFFLSLFGILSISNIFVTRIHSAYNGQATLLEPWKRIYNDRPNYDPNGIIKFSYENIESTDDELCLYILVFNQQTDPKKRVHPPSGSNACTSYHEEEDEFFTTVITSDHYNEGTIDHFKANLAPGWYRLEFYLKHKSGLRYSVEVKGPGTGGTNMAEVFVGDPPGANAQIDVEQPIFYPQGGRVAITGLPRIDARYVLDLARDDQAYTLDNVTFETKSDGTCRIIEDIPPDRQTPLIDAEFLAGNPVWYTCPPEEGFKALVFSKNLPPDTLNGAQNTFTAIVTSIDSDNEWLNTSAEKTFTIEDPNAIIVKTNPQGVANDKLPITVTVEKCPFGNIVDLNATAESQTIPFPNIPVNENDIAEKQIQLPGSGSGILYTIIATCTNNIDFIKTGQTTLTVFEAGRGREQIQIRPEEILGEDKLPEGHEAGLTYFHIQAGIDFTIVLRGLASGLAASECYVIKIVNVDTGQSIKKDGQPKAEQGSCEAIAQNTDIYLASATWGNDVETLLPISKGEVGSGEYRIFLFFIKDVMAPGNSSEEAKKIGLIIGGFLSKLRDTPCKVGVELTFIENEDGTTTTIEGPPKQRPDDSGDSTDWYDKCLEVDTGVGNISTTPGKFLTRVIGLILGVAGGIALLLIMYEGYKVMMARGNPEVMQSAREMITSAIVGLLFIIFSLVILEFVGVDVLAIPGFETNTPQEGQESPVGEI
ncbi:MAG TPA: pilin [Patescibacteria group bacterium]|nr:pilin [Patescibacteria group bacterium]